MPDYFIVYSIQSRDASPRLRGSPHSELALSGCGTALSSRMPELNHA